MNIKQDKDLNEIIQKKAETTVDYRIRVDFYCSSNCNIEHLF